MGNSASKNRTSKKQVKSISKNQNSKKVNSQKVIKRNDNKNSKRNIENSRNKQKTMTIKNPKKVPDTKVVKKKDYNIKKFPNKNSIENKNQEKVKKRPINQKKRILLISIFVLIGMMICAIYFTFHLTTFDLKKITVTGNSKYTSSEIISNSPFKLNENIFSEYLRYKDVELTNLPYVADLKVDIVFPDEISLKVIERTSKYIAYDKEKNKFFRLDQDGYILEETSQNEKKEKEMLIYGITFNNKIVLGEQINAIDLSKLKIYEKISEKYEKSGINGNITKVNFENSLTIITLNDKLNVILPNDTNLEYKLDLLKSILKKNGELQGVIDMTKNDPVFSIF
ncbi:MAG: FtsQ-type POTRA domain-containing protein [Clostridia bacterium]|nr:FtsQ-type POTRA domain-containing protein [Clostridia bacterium]